MDFTVYTISIHFTDTYLKNIIFFVPLSFLFAFAVYMDPRGNQQDSSLILISRIVIFTQHSQNYVFMFYSWRVFIQSVTVLPTFLPELFNGNFVQ